MRPAYAQPRASPSSHDSASMRPTHPTARSSAASLQADSARVVHSAAGAPPHGASPPGAHAPGLGADPMAWARAAPQPSRGHAGGGRAPGATLTPAGAHAGVLA